MPSAHPTKWGSKLGPRLAMLVSQAIIYTHARLLNVKHKLAMAVFHSISDEISDEVDITLGPILRKLHEMTPEDHPAYPMVNFLHTATGQLKAAAGTGLQISGILGSVAAIMNNELADVVYAYVRTNPHLLPDPGTLAQMAAASLITQAQCEDLSAAQGYVSGWTDNLIALSRNFPTVADGLDMMRRGLVTQDQFVEWQTLNAITPEVAGLFAALETVPLSPADAALAVLRGSMSQADGEKIAHENGLTPDSFATIIDNTGEPPGLEQLLEAYRRGIINQATLERGILQSRYRDEWIPTLEALRFEPMSVADAVNAVVQDQMDAATAETISEQNGLAPGQFQILYNTAGEPLSRTEMEQLYNRGLVTEDQVTQALRESRLKNKYTGLAFQLHTKIIDPGLLSRAVRYGGISEADAVAKAMENGYDKTDATTVVNAGLQERLQAHKDRVVSSVTALYETGTVAQSDAISVIRQMGYSDQEATFIVAAADYHREAHVISQVVNAVRSKYLAHHITSNQATGFLDAIGLPTSQRDFLMNLWGIEHDAYVRTLTEAQIVKAVNNDLITPQDGLSRLIALGYVEADAALLIAGA
jgi:Holliday junction resolvasome RuvABC DNA-binding subunit